MDIPVKQHTLIQGENGTGKSTLVKLLMGMYIPESGEILFDDVRTSDMNINLLRNHVVYVPQETSIFSKSVKENIIYGDNIWTNDELINVCEITGLDKFVEKMPNKYDTILEEQGKNISTGQKQRLAIARALLRKPDVLILDEATSNIDKLSEIAIYKNMRKYYPNMTLISISHNMCIDIVVDNVIQM